MAISDTFYFPYKYYYVLLVLLAFYLLPLPSFAADLVGTNPPPPPNVGGPSFTDSLGYLTGREFILSLLVIIFGVATLGVEYALIRTKPFESTDVFKILAVSLIVVGTLFLITAGFSSQQIAPAMGLFGTIAGYLLGRSSQKNEHDGKRKMAKFAISLFVFSAVITMPALAGDIMQSWDDPQHATLMRPNAIGLYNSADQDIIFVLATQDGREKQFSIPGNARWELSDESSSQYMIRIPTSGGREVRYPLSATKRYKIYWNSDARAWDVAIIAER